jgi:hypothetical protein
MVLPSEIKESSILKVTNRQDFEIVWYEGNGRWLLVLGSLKKLEVYQNSVTDASVPLLCSLRQLRV